jgi:hypothetical protein
VRESTGIEENFLSVQFDEYAGVTEMGYMHSPRLMPGGPASPHPPRPPADPAIRLLR